MTYTTKMTTKVVLECSYGLYQPWELQEATIIHEVVLSYREMYRMAVNAIGGAYTTYGAMVTLEETCGN